MSYTVDPDVNINQSIEFTYNTFVKKLCCNDFFFLFIFARNDEEFKDKTILCIGKSEPKPTTQIV